MTSPLPAPFATALPAPVFELVPFDGTEILATRQDDTVFVPMKRFCGTLGLPWDSARRRIDRDEVLREGAVMMTVPSDGGAQRQQTLPLDLIPGFLMGADASRYAPELQERIRTFRRTCYGVLFRHFFGGDLADRTPTAPAPTIVGAGTARSDALHLVPMIRAEPRWAVRTFLHTLLENACAAIGVEAPALATIVGDEAPPVDRIEQLVSGLHTLDARGVRYNHLGGDSRGRVAVNLPELARLFARADIDVAIDDALRAALHAGTVYYDVTVRTVASAIARRKAMHCHILEPRS